MQNLPLWCVRLSVFYAVFGMIMGVVMGSTGDHSLMPVHAHINVLGWVSLALFGIVFKVWNIDTGKLAWTQFGLFNVGIDGAAYGADVSVARAALKWVLQSPHVSCTIPAMNSVSEVEENAPASGAPLSNVEDRLVADLRSAFDEKVQTDPGWYYHRDWTRRLYGED